MIKVLPANRRASAGLVIAAALILSPAGPGALAAQGQAALTVQEKAQAATLASKILAVIKGTPYDSPQTAFESVILGVTAGAECAVIKASVGTVVATSGEPPAAVAAAQEVASACGPIGSVSQNPGLAYAPGFTPGGGGGSGANYSQ